MPIFIESKKRKPTNILMLYPQAEIIDVTSKGVEPYIKLSPFYPHGDIPIPFSDNYFSASVEGIWQGLKVFENQDVDPSKFYITTMKNLKRTVRKYGMPLGHRTGINGTKLLNYYEARINIYIPTYLWVLKNKVPELIEQIRLLAQNKPVVLLDYETNTDVFNLKKPLSHASLIKALIENHPSILL